MTPKKPLTDPYTFSRFQSRTPSRQEDDFTANSSSMHGRGRNHPGGGGRRTSDIRHHDTWPCARVGQQQYHDQYGHLRPPEQRHQHYHGHRPHQNYNRQQRHQHHHQQHQQQRQDEPNLYKTGDRPWTMYRRNTPRDKCDHSPAGTDMSDGTAAPCDAAVGEGRGERGVQGKGVQFTVVSYNVLADSLVSFEYIPYCKTWNDAAWKARPGRILQKVLDFRPAVVCLQEVDEDKYEGVFRKKLEPLGYVGTYCQRSGDKSDGCATFVLGQHMRLVEQDAVTYKLQGHPVLDRDNVALLVVVDILLPDQSQSESERPHAAVPPATPDADVSTPTPAAACTHPCDPEGANGKSAASSSPELCPAKRRPAARLVVANTHLLFNPKRGDIKAAQLMVLTGRVERMAKKSGADGVMICGDFNMTPDSALYNYMVRGALDMDGLNRFTVSGQCGLNNRRQYDQRKETDNSGVMPNRGCGSKHQGSGCSLGSFLRPAIPAAGRGGGRGRGWRGRRGRGGRGNKYFRQDVTSIPPQQGRVSCETCSGRRPHDAACTYVVADDPPLTAMDYYRPPGASPGTLFAVMDPVSCRCTTTGQHDGRGGGGASGGAENEFHKGRETHDPPILWPVQGNKIAYKRDRGPVFHNLDLKSAYAQQGDAWGTGEPAFSSYHHLFKGTVDYIFYGPGPPSDTGPTQQANSKSPVDPDPATAEEAMLLPGRGHAKSCLRCVGVAEPPLRRDLDRFGGLPSPEEPSDHVLLAARFEVTIP